MSKKFKTAALSFILASGLVFSNIFSVNAFAISDPGDPPPMKICRMSVDPGDPPPMR